MNPEIKTRWLESLRSGEYEQGKGELRDDHNRFCCLGVLCDIVKDELGLGWRRVGEDAVLMFDGESGTLGPTIRKHVGIKQGNAAYGEPDEWGDTPCLAADNDNGQSFEEIANTIEEYF